MKGITSKILEIIEELRSLSLKSTIISNLMNGGLRSYVGLVAEVSWIRSTILIRILKKFERNQEKESNSMKLPWLNKLRHLFLNKIDFLKKIQKTRSLQWKCMVAKVCIISMRISCFLSSSLDDHDGYLKGSVKVCIYRD